MHISGASEEIEHRLDNDALLTKDEIDLRIESLKAELDDFRDVLYKELEKKQREILE